VVVFGVPVLRPHLLSWPAAYAARAARLRARPSSARVGAVLSGSTIKAPPDEPWPSSGQTSQASTGARFRMAASVTKTPELASCPTTGACARQFWRRPSRRLVPRVRLCASTGASFHRRLIRQYRRMRNNGASASALLASALLASALRCASETGGTRRVRRGWGLFLPVPFGAW
jgi:hypothetical protein